MAKRTEVHVLSSRLDATEEWLTVAVYAHLSAAERFASTLQAAGVQTRIDSHILTTEA